MIYMLPVRSTAKGRGRNFKNRTPIRESLVVVNHRWQSESTDGLKGGWSGVFWNGYNGCSGHPVGHVTHNCWTQCGVVQL